MTPDTLNSIVRARNFTSRNADLRRVQDLYQDVFPAISTKRQLVGGDWTATQAQQLIKVLPVVKHVVML